MTEEVGSVRVLLKHNTDYSRKSLYKFADKFYRQAAKGGGRRKQHSIEEVSKTT